MLTRDKKGDGGANITHMTKLRLGLCDAVPPEFYLPGDATDPEKFIAMFEGIGAELVFETYEVTQGVLPESYTECDAYLITGSPCSVYDTYTWIDELEAFIGSLHAAGTPLVGICFGHQLIAQTLGGRVELADGGWLLGLHEIEVSRDKPWMEGEPGTHPLYFINQDQVVELPPESERLAGSASCPNAMYSIAGHILSMQPHPEQPLASMRAFSRKLLDDYGLDRNVYDSALDSMDRSSPDAELFARWILEFLSNR